MRRDRSGLVLIAGALLILASAIAYLQPWNLLVDADTRAWRLTLVGKDGSSKTLTYKDVTSLPAYAGDGGFFSSVGIVYGPYPVRGVTVEELCNQVGGVGQGDAVMVSARDGYSTVLSYEQVMGDFIAYTPDLREVPDTELQTILMYRLDGKPLDDEGGRPLRLAVVSPAGGLLTEGSYWVKWVTKIEVLRAP